MNEKLPLPAWTVGLNIPDLPAPYYWTWQDNDLNIMSNAEGVQPTSGDAFSPAYENMDCIAFVNARNEVRCLLYEDYSMRHIGTFPDAQTAINAAVLRLLAGEWE